MSSINKNVISVLIKILASIIEEDKIKTHHYYADDKVNEHVYKYANFIQLIGLEY